SRAHRWFQSPNGSHFSPSCPGRKTSRSVVRMKFGRIGSANSARPFSSRSTERPVLIAQIAPASCNSPINSIHCELNTGSVARETSVPSKSILSSRIGERIRNNLRIDFREAMRRLFEERKNRDEIGLRTRNRTPSKSVALALAYSRTEEGTRRSGFQVSGENCREGAFP